MNGMDAPLSQDGSPAPMDQQPRTLALMNQKGGVGKTTTTVNLGAALARLGRRCLLVDLDPQAHCTLHFGIEPGSDAPTVYDLLLDPQCSIYEVLHPGRDHLDIIPAEVSLAGAEVELTTQPGREMILKEKLTAVNGHYDYILFDCPPSLGLLTLNALVASMEVIIPMQAHFLPLQGVGKLLETVALVKQRLNPALSVGGIVLCAHDGHTTLAREIVADLRSFFESSKTGMAWQGCRIFDPPIRRNVKVAEAPSFGQTVFEYAPWCAGAQDYERLAEGMLMLWEGTAEDLTESVPATAIEAHWQEVEPEEAGDELHLLEQLQAALNETEPAEIETFLREAYPSSEPRPVLVLAEEPIEDRLGQATPAERADQWVEAKPAAPDPSPGQEQIEPPPPKAEKPRASQPFRLAGPDPTASF